MRIHVTGSVPAAVASALAADFELADGPEGADGILSLLTTSIDADYLDRAGPQLRIVANYAVGVNNIDLDAARTRGVLVANTPDVLTRPTAELTVTLMLSLLRRVTEGDRLIRRGEPLSRLSRIRRGSAAVRRAAAPPEAPRPQASPSPRASDASRCRGAG